MTISFPTRRSSEQKGGILAAEIQETSPYRGAAPREGADIATLFERAVATGKQAGKVWRSRLARLAAAARLASRRRIRRRAALAIARFGLARRFGPQHQRPDRKRPRLNSSYYCAPRMPSSSCKQKT